MYWKILSPVEGKLNQKIDSQEIGRNKKYDMDAFTTPGMFGVTRRPRLPKNIPLLFVCCSPCFYQDGSKHYIGNGLAMCLLVGWCLIRQAGSLGCRPSAMCQWCRSPWFPTWHTLPVSTAEVYVISVYFGPCMAGHSFSRKTMVTVKQDH